MASTFDEFYDMNPVSHIDQNQWDEKISELHLAFRQMPVLYTPLIDWTNESQMTNGARTTIWTEMLEGDVDIDEIPANAYYIDTNIGVDTRSRTLASKRYGDKAQLHESSNMWQRFVMNGSRDWRPLMRGMLSSNYIRKHELLARNAFLMQPKEFWTFGGNATDFATIGAGDELSPEMTLQWALRLGNTGTPVVPGDGSGAKVALCAPGAVYDYRKVLASAATNEAQMWRDAQIYAGQAIKFEIGTHNGVRFQQVPNDKYGENLAVLYNAGAITAQYGVALPIGMGDGSPDPESAAFKVDDVWSVGQKNVVHWIQLEAAADMTKFAKHDIVSIHVQRTSDFGVTNGCEFRSGKTIQRRVMVVDAVNKRLSFDRPIMSKYAQAFQATPVSGVAGLYYAFVTKATHIGFTLVLGSRGGIMGKIDRPVKFHEPKPIDDFESVWRFVWDEYAGLNLWDPNLFECHFHAITLPKPGGLI